MAATSPRRRPKHSPRTGHYAGTTSQGEPISFDFTETNGVTNLIATLANVRQSEVITVSAFFPVAHNGRWGGILSASDLTLRIEGHLREDGNADGILHAQFNGVGPGSRLARLTLSWFARS